MTFSNEPLQRRGSAVVLATGLMTLWAASLALVTPSTEQRRPEGALQGAVEALQARLRESREVRTEFVATIWYHKTGPIQVRQRRPDWLLVDAASWGENPREVCWLEHSRAGIFQDWPDRRTRGVRIDHLPELFGGDQERAFDAMLRYSETSVAGAGIGLQMLRMIGSAPVEKLLLKEVDGAVRASIDVRDLKEPGASNFETLDGKRTTFVFEVQRPQNGTPVLRWARTEHEGLPIEAGTSVHFSRLDFEFDPSDAPLPAIPDSLLKPVRLTKPEELGLDLLYPLPLRRSDASPAPRELSP